MKSTNLPYLTREFEGIGGTFDSRYHSLGGEDSGFKGKAAGAFRDLLFNIVDTARKAKDKDGKPVPESAASREAGQKLLKIDPARHAQLTPPPAPTGLPF